MVVGKGRMGRERDAKDDKESALRPAPCALRSALCALRSALCALHSALCTLRPALCTLHSALCALRLAYFSLDHAPLTPSYTQRHFSGWVVRRVSS